jgi:hypothetical protein
MTQREKSASHSFPFLVVFVPGPEEYKKDRVLILREIQYLTFYNKELEMKQ